jgi:two-component system sensor histidine kinase BaeS
VADRPDPRQRLLVALAHEVGNLLAAVRLSAHLLPHAAEPRERARGARQIEHLAAQAGELLAQVRPLLATARSKTAVAPGEVLEGVGRALADAPGFEKLALLAAARALPDVRVDPDALLQALLALARGALDAAPEGGSVTLGARRTGRHVVFELADGGRGIEQPPKGALPRGRALAVRLADAALRRDGGRADAASRGGTTRVRVFVAVAAPAPKARSAKPRRAKPKRNARRRAR